MMGTGTLDVSTANTYSGSTIVSNGTLTLDFTQPSSPANNIISSSSALSLGDATLNILGSSSASSSQSFASTAFTAGNGQIVFGNNNNPTLALGSTITAVKGATVEFPATGGTNTTTATGGAAGGVLGTGVGANDTAGFATFGTSDWAIGSGGVFPVEGLSSVGGYQTTIGGTGQGANVDLQANLTLTGNSGATTIRFNTPGATNLFINKEWLVVNAILVTPNMGENNVTIWTGNGTTTGGAFFGDYNAANYQQVYLWQNNTAGYFINNGFLANGRGAASTTGITSYIQAGPGTVVMGTDTYSGPYSGTNFLNGGSTVITVDNCLGVPSRGAPVFLSGGTLVANATVTLDNAGVNARPIALFNQGGGLAAATGYTLTVDGLISGGAGTGPLIIGIPASAANGNVAGLLPGSGPNTANTTPVYATGTVKLTGANTYSGGTVLDGGVLNMTSTSLGTGGVTFNGGTLQWNSSSPDISSQHVTINAGGATMDANGNTVTLANGIGRSGSGALLVTNSGPTGTGIILLDNGLSSSGGVTVVSGAGFGGAGTVIGNVTWNSGASVVLSSSSPMTLSGVASLSGNAVTVIGASLTSSGSPYTLLTAAGGFGSSTVNPTPGGNAIAAGYLGSISISGNNLILTVTAVPSAGWTDGDNTGNWSDPLNWSATFGTPPPSGAEATAVFGTGASPVNLNTNETVGTISFNSSSIPYTISGTNALTLNSLGNGAVITLATGAAPATIATALSLSDNLTATVSGGDTLTIANIVRNTSTPKTLTVNGAGTLALSGTNTYGPSAGTVGTTLSGGGTLQLGGSSALGLGDLSVSSGTIQAGAPGLTLSNNIVLGGTATVNNNGNNLTLGGTILGPGGLTTTANSGTLVLAGNNSYSGMTTINGGSVIILADNGLGADPGLSTLDVILNGGDLVGNGTFALNINRNIGLGPIAGSTGGTGYIDATNGSTLTVNGIVETAGNTGANNLDINGMVASPGTVALGAPGTFTGSTIISAGVLQLNNSMALQDSTLVYNPGGTLSFGSLTAATVNGLTGTQNLGLTNALGAGVALTIGYDGASGAFSGNLSGSGSLDEYGPGTQVLSNATYSGGTIVNCGEVILDNPQIASGHVDISAVGGAGVVGALPANVVINGGSLTSSGGLYITSATGNQSAGGVFNAAATLVITNNAIVTGNPDANGRAISFGMGNCRPVVGTYMTVGMPGIGDQTVVYANGALDMFDSSAGGTVGNCAVNLDAGTLLVNNIQETTGGGNQTATFNFDGGVLEAATNDPVGGQFLPALTGLTVNVTNATVPAFINTSNFSITIAANLNGNSSDDGLVKLGSGKLYLSGANTYTGLTTVSNGSLFISGALNNSSENFAVNDGHGFGALYSGTTPTVGTVTLGQSNGSRLLFTNITSTSSAMFEANAINLNGTCTLKVLDAVNLSAGNEYPLVQIVGTITTNSGAGFVLSLPAGVSGILTNDPSIIPGYTTLALEVTSIVPYTPPVTFTGVTISGNGLVLNATGGNPGDPVSVLSATNLTLPLTQWTTVTSGNYDGNGNFTYTVTGALSSGQPQQFYILKGQ